MANRSGIILTTFSKVNDRRVMATALISLLFPVKQLRRIVEKAYKMSGNFAMKTN